jgi:glycosyltransferase involved in cell wall biosynthesis
MKIFYDHYIFSYLRFGGISTYFNALLDNIPQENWYTSTIFSNNQQIKELNKVKTFRVFPNFDFRGQERLMCSLNMPYTKYKLRSINWDIFHATRYLTPFLGFIRNKPTVVTVHDLIYEVFYNDKDIPHRKKIIKMEKENVMQADKIIAVSEYTKNDIINIWGIDENKIKVIYHGINKNKMTISKKRSIANPYVLFVGGGRGKNKNFEHLVESFSFLTRKFNDIKLVCTGPAFRKNEVDMLYTYKIMDKVVNIYATTQEMAQLYHDAEMLIVPSYYEGFGFPVLEAMVYDCPVLLSNTSCLPEIAKKAAIYFNPYNSEEMYEKMVDIINSSELKKNLALLGNKRLNDFSWQKCANEHIALYKTLL